MSDMLMPLDGEALELAAKAVGSTAIASLAITTYLNTLADRLEGTIEIRELGPLQFPEAPPQPPQSPDNQPQLPGVHWEDYEESPG